MSVLERCLLFVSLVSFVSFVSLVSFVAGVHFDRRHGYIRIIFFVSMIVPLDASVKVSK